MMRSPPGRNQALQTIEGAFPGKSIIFFAKKQNNWPEMALKETVETFEIKKVSIVSRPLWKNWTSRKRF